MSNIRLQDPALGDSFESMMRRFFAPVRLGGDMPSVEMRIDLDEADDAYHVKAELPGVEKQDIQVRIDGNVVRIDAQVRKDKQEQGDKGRVLCAERYYGAVSRSFSLPVDVDEGRAQARYANGVLRLDLPKKAAAGSHKLAIE
ncbi:MULTISPECIES: Hsp20/alpha crystallin family protein [Ramlibacter]|uniref:Hsp20/alpha crystallin family protein n=1 Tax=Ramlibacter aquaticus TaxID=2780094 RepID=A0ABR9SHQ3_9BURK|nr:MULTISPECIES: Hsp20/alpha crystallin family protein [Ramlibacter]MBE7941888.1 Hsp20/alpha crystallin family protein [Ramlibacter aquaticus]